MKYVVSPPFQGPLGSVSHRVAISVCLSVCWGHRETPTSGGRGDLWLKNIFLILACDDKIVKKKCESVFSPRSIKYTVLDQPTVDNGGVIRGRSVLWLLAVGCWLLALPWHFNGTSMAKNTHKKHSYKK